MYRSPNPLFITCNTPTHVGSGSELGVVDLPIQRERHTGFPKFEASSLKGSLREAFERKKADEVIIHRVFGYDSSSASQQVNNVIPEKERQFSGSLGFSDARLLLFPIKSMKGIFAWATCLRALKQFLNDMQLANADFKIHGLMDSALSEKETYLFNPDSNLRDGNNVLLEEYTFPIANELNGVVQVEHKNKKTNFPDWLADHVYGEDSTFWSEKIKKDIVVLADDEFKDFVHFSTEVITRTKIDNTTGTVAQGALFNEEYLPTESIMYSLVLTAPEFRQNEPMTEPEVRKFFSDTINEIKTFQIGANATLGKGIVTSKFVEL